MKLRTGVPALAFLFVCFWMFSSVGANTPPGTEKAKSRLEELFLWKISDTLGLTNDEEEKFRTNFKSLNDKKSKASQELDRLMTEMEKQSDQKKLSQSLEDYNKSLASYSNVQMDEAKSMRKLLGDKRFAQYLILKRDLNQKLKNMLSTPSRPESTQPKD